MQRYQRNSVLLPREINEVIALKQFGYSLQGELFRKVTLTHNNVITVSSAVSGMYLMGEWQL